MMHMNTKVLMNIFILKPEFRSLSRIRKILKHGSEFRKFPPMISTHIRTYGLGSRSFLNGDSEETEAERKQSSQKEVIYLMGQQKGGKVHTLEGKPKACSSDKLNIVRSRLL